MSDLGLAILQAAAAADPRPRASTPDEIRTLTQRLIDDYRPRDSVYEFLSARTLDTTVPPY
jgi:hypothetical protein